MKGVLYARYSPGPNQTEQSIEGQIADGRSYAEKNGINIVKIYADRKVSGKSTVGRDQFLQMMEDAEKGLFECVIVWKIDRFGRNRQDIAFNKYKLKKAGVKLLYSAETIPDTPEGIILESVMEGLAEYYSADLSQKVSRGIRESAKKGKVPWAMIPIGFYKGEDNLLHKDEKSAKAVQDAFQMYVDGATLKEICEMFSERGIRGRRGSEIKNGVLYRMFRNRAYLGQIEVMGIDVEIEPLIDKRIFDLAQTRNDAPKSRNAAGKANVNYLLSCKCFCGYCGGMLTGESGTGKKGKAYHYYKCGKQKRKESTCELKIFKKDSLERLVIETTLNDVLQDSVIDKIVNEIMKLQEEEKKNDPTAVIKKKIERVKAKERNLLTAIEDSGSTILAERLEELEYEEGDLEAQLDKIKLEDTFIPEEAIRFWLNKFKNGDIENEDFCNQIMDTFVSRIDIKNDELTIHYNIRGMCSDTVSSMDYPAPYPNTIPLNIPTVYNNQILLRLQYDF